MRVYDVARIEKQLMRAGTRKSLVNRVSFVLLGIAYIALSLFGLFVFDYLTDFPALLRPLLALSVLAYFAGYRVWRRRDIFRSETDFFKLARETELRAGELREKGFNSLLVSAVEFAHTAAIRGSGELKKRVVDEAHSPEYDPVQVPLHDRALTRSFSRAFPLFIAVYILWALIATDTMGIFFMRVVGMNVAYPTSTLIMGVEYPETAGESRDVPIKILAAGVVPETGRLEVRYRSESMFSVPLEKGEGGTFSAVLQSVPKSLSFSVHIGDAHSRDFHIEVIRPPYISSGTINITPPPYTGVEPRSREIGNFEFPEKGRFSMNIKTNRPVEVCELELKSEDGFRSVPLEKSGDGYVLKDMSVDKTQHFALKLVDSRRIENEDRLFYVIAYVKDQLPSVNLARPATGTYYAPVSNMNWVVKASDDYGMEKAELRYVVKFRNDDGTERKHKEGSIPLKDLSGMREAEFSGILNLSKIGVSPGMSVDLVVRVTDNNDLREAEMAGVCEPVEINIVNPGELRTILREEMLNVNKMIEDMEADMKYQVRILNMQIKKEQ